MHAAKISIFKLLNLHNVTAYLFMFIIVSV